MARIIYGVQGEGRGHSSRSKVIIEHLIKKGHEVKIITSRNAHSYLSSYFEDVTNIMGLELVFDKQRVNILKTLKKNIEKSKLEGRKTLKILQKTTNEFKPNLAITDFEPFIPLISKIHKIPFISINHQHIIAHCEIEYPNSWQKQYLFAFTVTNNMYWFAKHYFVTSFYFPELKNKFLKKTTLVNPILRREVLKQKIRNKNHILIYSTANENEMILSLAKKSNQKFIVYGFKKKQSRIKNITFKEPSTEGFLKDLAESKAVITNGGYSLISEALFLRKPIYSIPIQNQFEQMLNGYYLEKLGYGLYDLTPYKKRIDMFLDGLSFFKKNISRDKLNFNGNKKLFKMLDRKIEELSL